MKKILNGILASSLILSLCPSLPQAQATEGSPAPILVQTLGANYVSELSQVADYLNVSRNVSHYGTGGLDSEPSAFSQYEAETQRGLAGNRTVYHQILNQIISPSMSDNQKVKAIYDFPMYNFIRYDTTRETLPASYLRTGYDKSAMTVLDRGSWLLGVGTGGCQEYATLFDRLMNTAGFPTFTEYGDYVNTNGSTVWHAFSRAKVNGTWYWFDVDVDGSVYRRGTSSPLYFLFQKSTSYWRTNHAWNEAVTTAKEQEIDSMNYKKPNTIFSYEGVTQVSFQGKDYSPSVPVYGYVGIDSNFFNESVMLLPFHDVGKFLGLTTYWDNEAHRLVMENNGTRHAYSVDSYTYYLNGVAKKMAVPLKVIDDVVYISADDLILQLDLDLNMDFYRNSQGQLVTYANFQGGNVSLQG